MPGKWSECYGSGASQGTGSSCMHRGPASAGHGALCGAPVWHIEEGIPLSEVAREAAVPLRSLQRWLARYRAAGLVGLARAQRSDTGTRKLPAELVAVIEGMALRKPRPSIATMHRRMTAWTCSHDTGHIWEEILPHPSESMSLILQALERQRSAVSWGRNQLYQLIFQALSDLTR